jgi:hypothetical protein
VPADFGFQFLNRTDRSSPDSGGLHRLSRLVRFDRLKRLIRLRLPRRQKVPYFASVELPNVTRQGDVTGDVSSNSGDISGDVAGDVWGDVTSDILLRVLCLAPFPANC